MGQSHLRIVDRHSRSYCRCWLAWRACTMMARYLILFHLPRPSHKEVDSVLLIRSTALVPPQMGVEEKPRGCYCEYKQEEESQEEASHASYSIANDRHCGKLRDQPDRRGGARSGPAGDARSHRQSGASR